MQVGRAQEQAAIRWLLGQQETEPQPTGSWPQAQALGPRSSQEPAQELEPTSVQELVQELALGPTIAQAQARGQARG